MKARLRSALFRNKDVFSRGSYTLVSARNAVINYASSTTSRSLPASIKALKDSITISHGRKYLCGNLASGGEVGRKPVIGDNS